MLGYYLCDPSVPPTTPLLASLLQAQWSHCWSLCLECSSPRPVHFLLLPSFRDLPTVTLSTRLTLTFLSKIAPPALYLFTWPCFPSYHLLVCITPGTIWHSLIGFFNVTLTPWNVSYIPRPEQCLTSNVSPQISVGSMSLLFTFHERPSQAPSQLPFPFILVIDVETCSDNYFSQLLLIFLIVLWSF